MTRYSAQPRYRIFVKGYRFLSFARNMRKNIGKNIIKSLSSKCSQKLYVLYVQLKLIQTKTASKRAIQNTAEVTGDLIGNKIADKITKVSRSSLQNSSETVENETKNTGLDREIPTERYMFPK